MKLTDQHDPNETPGISARLLGLGIAAMSGLVVGLGIGAFIF